VFHGGYVYPPGTDTSKLASTPQKPTVAAKTPAPKPESKVARSTPTSTPTPTPTYTHAPSRHSERSEESRPLADSPSASDDTTEPEAVPTPSTSAEPVEPPPADETPDEAEIDDVNTTDGWQLVATILSYGYLIAALVAAAAGIIWLLLKLEKKPTKLARKTFFVALGTCVVLWGITYTILTYILQ
ncbi:MAG: hypothetical protein PHP37_03650, partial [Patescibacteria group bacterium]|nr:hypothetical protein [Patescibacteria group bacterium]